MIKNHLLSLASLLLITPNAATRQTDHLFIKALFPSYNTKKVICETSNFVTIMLILQEI